MTTITESYKTRLISRVSEAVELAEQIFKNSESNPELELLAKLHQLQGYVEALLESDDKPLRVKEPRKKFASGVK